MARLSEIPFLDRFRAREAQIQQEPLRDLQQAQGVMTLAGLLQKQAMAQQAAQRQAQIERDRQTLPPEEFARRYASPDALLRAGDGGYTLAPGAIRFDRAGNPVAMAPTTPAPQRPMVVPPGSTVLEPGSGKPIFTAPERPEKPGYKERQVSYDGKTYTKEFSNDNGQTWQPIAGSKPVSVRDASGAANIVNNMGLGKEGSNKVDTGLLDTTKGIMTLTAIEGQFKPAYQQFMPRLSAGWASIKEKAGLGIGTQDAAFLREFTAYKRNAINTMNEYIKSITGAAMSEPEARRILQGMPRVGEGMFDGDSPTEFKAKLDDAMQQTKMALARYTYIKRNGIALSDANGNPVVPLERMPQIMNERGRVLESEIKKSLPNMPQQVLQQRVRQLLAKEFGLVE